MPSKVLIRAVQALGMEDLEGEDLAVVLLELGVGSSIRFDRRYELNVHGQAHL